MKPRRAAAMPPTEERTLTAAAVEVAVVEPSVLKVAEEEVSVVVGASVASVEAELVPVLLENRADCEETLERLSDPISLHIH
jgi:hypothetical protein